MQMKIETKALSDSMLANFSPKKNGAGGDFAALLKTAETKKPDAASELEAYLKKPLGERVAMALRKQLGISEEEYAAMTPDQKKAVDAKVADLLKRKMDEETAKQQAKASSIQL
jgi:ABC-type molybdenum transport system ATPase subunit/photorepair protein PhrA